MNDSLFHAQTRWLMSYAVGITSQPTQFIMNSIPEQQAVHVKLDKVST